MVFYKYYNITSIISQKIKVECISFMISLIHTRNNRSPMIDPCGTRAFIVSHSEETWINYKYPLLSIGKIFVYPCHNAFMPIVSNFLKKPWCQTLSNAFLILQKKCYNFFPVILCLHILICNIKNWQITETF